MFKEDSIQKNPSQNHSYRFFVSAVLLTTALSSTAALARRDAVPGVDILPAQAEAASHPASPSKNGDPFYMRWGKGYVDSQVRTQVDAYVPEVAHRARVKIRQALYGTGEHVENERGEVTGVVVANKSYAIRRFMQTAFGTDLADSLPGPAFVRNAVIDLLENYIAGACGDQLERGVVALVERGSKAMLEKAFGLVSAPVDTTVTLEADVNSSAVAAALTAKINEGVDEEHLRSAYKQALDEPGLVSSITNYVRDCLGQFRLWITRQVESSISSAANGVISIVADNLHEQGLKTTEAAVGAVTTLAGGAIAGPAGAYFAGSALIVDDHLKTKETPSYLSRFARWLGHVTGADKLRDAVKVHGQWRALNFAHSLMDKIGRNLGFERATDSSELKTVKLGEPMLGDDDEIVLVDDPHLLKMPSLAPVMSQLSAKVQSIRAAAGRAVTAAAKTSADVFDAAEDFFDAMNGAAAHEDDTAVSTPAAPTIDPEDPWAPYLGDQLSPLQQPAKKSWWRRVIGF